MSEFTKQMENCNTTIFDMTSMKIRREKELLENQTEKERIIILSTKEILNAVEQDGKSMFKNETERKTAISDILFYNVQYQGILDKIQQLQSVIEEIDNQISFQKRLYRINELLEMRDQGEK